MGEIVQRLTGIMARTSGNIVSPGVSALMLAASIATGNPDLGMWAGPVGSLGGALTEEGVNLASRTWSDRSERVQRLIDEAESDSAMSIDDLMRLISESEAARRLLGAVVSDATEAHDDAKVRLLAKIFVQGALDEAKVDELIYLCNMTRELQGPEIRVLSAYARLSQAATEWGTIHSGTRAPNVTTVIGRSMFKDFCTEYYKRYGLQIDAVPEIIHLGREGRVLWSPSEISSVDIKVGRVAILLCQRLASTGLLESDREFFRISALGAYCADLLVELECDHS